MGGIIAMIYTSPIDNIGEKLNDFLKNNLLSEETPKIILRSEKLSLAGIKITSKDIHQATDKPPVIFFTANSAV